MNTKAPEITGTSTAGETVSCSTGSWSNSPTSYAYEWRLEGVQIAGQIASTLKLTAEEEGKKILCVVTAKNETGPSAAAQSPPVTVATPIIAPVNSGVPSISGQTEAGDQLQCSPGTWTGSPTFTYRWVRDGVPISGATGASYEIVPADEGHTLSCIVTASDGLSASATSTSIPVPKSSLALSCAGRSIVLVSFLQSGHSVVLTGFALRKYAGKKVTITISDVPKRYAKGKGGSTMIGTDGSFTAKLPLPKGKLAPLTRYTATVEGQASLGLKLGRNLLITAATTVSAGAKVSFHFSGARGPGKGAISITREESCTQNKVVATAKLSKSNNLTVTLPAPTTAGETFYYRAQTKIAAGITYSLPIAVSNG